MSAELDARLRQDLLKVEAGAGHTSASADLTDRGKSHSWLTCEAALQQGYAVSAINLDPRKRRTQFRQVYRALLHGVDLPGGVDHLAASTSLIEPGAPRPRRSRALRGHRTSRWSPSCTQDAACLQSYSSGARPAHTGGPATVAAGWHGTFISGRQTFPGRFGVPLQGDAVPVARLRAALKYRQVSFYRQASLALSGDEPFLQMVLALPQLFRRMGYRGWVLLFDEGEAIAQVRRPHARSQLSHLAPPALSRPPIRASIPYLPSPPTSSNASRKKITACPSSTAITPRPGASSRSIRCVACHRRTGGTFALPHRATCGSLWLAC